MDLSLFQPFQISGISESTLTVTVDQSLFPCSSARCWLAGVHLGCLLFKRHLCITTLLKVAWKKPPKTFPSCVHDTARKAFPSSSVSIMRRTLKALWVWWKHVQSLVSCRLFWQPLFPLKSQCHAPVIAYEHFFIVQYSKPFFRPVFIKPILGAIIDSIILWHQ